MKKKAVQPTDGELAILSVLWDKGPSTVREVNEAISREKPTGYTTTLKIMQIMVEKGLLERDASGFAHVYRSAVREADVQKHAVTRLMEQAFAGSAGKLVMRALSTKRVTPEELARIRKVIDDMEEEGT